VVSTGVGGGVVVEGRLHHGASGNAGHVGHVIVSARGLRCYCGARGCLTMYASGTGLAARARAAVERGEPSSLAALVPAEISGLAIAQAASEGDALGGRLMEQAASALARGIAGAANLLDLDRVVIGGGVAQSGELLFVPLRRALKRTARLAFSRNLEVRPAQLGREAGVIGAAALALQSRE
jgi:glucokinase